MTVGVPPVSVSSPRLELPQPMAATLGDLEATITEVGLTMCLARHATRVKVASTIPLQFVWGEDRVRIDAKVVRSTMQFAGGKPVYVSELQVADSVEGAPEVIRRIIASLVAPPAVEPPPPGEPKPQSRPEPQPEPGESKFVVRDPGASTSPESRIPNPAPAASEPVAPPPASPAPLIYERVPFLRYDDDAEDEARPAPFMQCTFADGRWRRERVADPAQPDGEGFTILAPADDEEADALCRTYEVADPETRKMMRFSFELAIEQSRK